MFPNNLDTDRYPLATRLWGVAIGLLLMAATALTLVTPGTLAVTMPVCLFAIVFAAFWRNMLFAAPPAFGSGSIISAAFFAYAMLSASWADFPRASFLWVLSTCLAFLGCGIASRSMLSEPRRNIFHIGEGVWIGFLAGLTYLAIEFATDQAIKIAIYNAIGLGPPDLRPTQFFHWQGAALVGISADDLTRSVAPVALLLWPVLLIIRGISDRRLAAWLPWFCFGLATLVIAMSVNETAKVGLALGVIAFLLSQRHAAATVRIIQICWIGACLAIVPASLALYRLDVHNAGWLQPTGQHRVIIWNRIAEETMKSPMFGIGAGMTYWNYDDDPLPKEGDSFRRYSRDAHNVFLQTWFELGVVGATLLALFGLAILQKIERLGQVVTPYGLAMFASSSATLASSWGMWRPWFVYIFAFAVVLFAVAIRSVIRAQRTPGLAGAVA